MDYACGIWVDRVEDPRRRRGVVALSMALNLGMLGYFKYFHFFAESLQGLLAQSGVSIPLGHLEVALPIGISFYTFQSMSYVIDVYRRQIKPTRNLVEFATFVSFFPHLVAGPIMRPTTLLPQVASRRRSTWISFTRFLFDFLGAAQEGRGGGQPGADRQRPVRSVADSRWGIGLAGDLCIRVSDLRRFLRVHRHRPRRGQVPGFRAHLELQTPLFRDQSQGLLGTLAHQPLALAPRLPLHFRWVEIGAALCGRIATSC